MSGFDQEILQDFLTESGELLEQLDHDLVLLEQTPRDPELLNRVFRALHTIKGSASFLALTNLVNLAHAAESALNAARNGQALIGREAMDLLLSAVDVLKRQFEDLTNGRDLVKADDLLVASLTAIGEGRTPPPAVPRPTHKVEAPVVAPAQAKPVADRTAELAPANQATDEGVSRTPLSLPDNKSILVEFLVQDLRETVEHASDACALISVEQTRQAGWSKLGEMGENLLKAAIFFEFPVMQLLAEAIVQAANAPIADEFLEQGVPRVLAALSLIKEQAEGLGTGMVVSRPLGTLCAQLSGLASGQPVEGMTMLGAGASGQDALLADGVIRSAGTFNHFVTTTSDINVDALIAPNAATNATTNAETGNQDLSINQNNTISATSATEVVSANDPVGEIERANAALSELERQIAEPAQDPAALPELTPVAHAAMTAAPAAAPSSTSVDDRAAATNDASSKGAKESASGAGAAVEQTIRVEVGRLEALLNLVGELVLQKNRLSAIARGAIASSLGTGEFQESFATATGTLDRVTGDIQMAVMRTRMQPLEKLFGKYPRLIRDLARKTNKEMRLVVEGGETEVDKSVIEELGDPLVHLLRNSADHGIEVPEQRKGTNKPECGTITLSARHEGSHVRIQIKDDGRGLSRAKIAKKAVERGLVSESEVAKMSDADVNAFIFAAGFSTAEKVTDLSGRGVGMDVVKTNIQKIKGTIDLASVEGQGTTITIKIPLTVAILTAMMVRVGPEIYAVPLASIVEIVKPESAAMSTINGVPVLRLRETVLPLLDGCDVFELPEKRREATPFVVVVALGDKRIGLRVSGLIGQQEIVIKPLDAGMKSAAGPVSGATVRDDGGVSLIVDVVQMVKLGEVQSVQRRDQISDNPGASIRATPRRTALSHR